MSDQIISNFESMLEQGQDNALIRFSLGNACLNAKDYEQAVKHLALALKHDPDYSAAWKLYGKALVGAENIDEAITAYQKGIEIAENKGDIQAAREMNVFLKRLL